MKMLFWCLVFCFSAASQAALLTLQADRTQYQVGETVQLNLWLSDFTGTVGSYWAKLHYEPAAFAFADGQFSDGFAGASLQYLQAVPASGQLIIEEYAFWDADELQLSLLQQRRFALARFNFLASASGSWTFSFADDFVGAEYFNGSPLALQKQVFQLQVRSVAEPGAWLFFLALAVLGYRRHRR